MQLNNEKIFIAGGTGFTGKVLKQRLTEKTVLSSFIFLSSFFIYLLTIGPSFNFLDSPEFIAFSYNLDIPHPPGHPLYPILGKLLSFLPFGSIAFKVNLLSAIFASLTAIIIYYLIHTFLEISIRKTTPTNAYIIKTSSVVSTLSIILTYPFWIQAVRAEVYSLNSFFVSLLIFILIRFIWHESLCSSSQMVLKDKICGNDKKRGIDSLSVTPNSSDTIPGFSNVIPDSIGNLTNSPQLLSKYFFIFSFVLGLAYCNHTLAITLLLPAFFFLVICTKRGILKDIKLFSLALIFFIAGFSIYLYLPVRSSTHLYSDWGNPENVQNFIAVISGSQYQQRFSFPDNMQLLHNLKNHFSLFSDQLTYSFILFAIIGFIFLIKRDLLLALFSLILFVCGLAGTVLQPAFFKTNPDSHGYLFTSFLMITIWLSYGIYIILALLHALSARLNKTRSLKWDNKWILRAFSILLLLTPITIFSISYSYADRSDSYFPRAFTKKILNSLRPNSIIFSGADNIMFPFWYYQVCENRFQSLIVIDQSWFLNFEELGKAFSKYYDKIKFPSRQIVNNWVKTLPAGTFNDLGLKEPFPPWSRKLFKNIILSNVGNHDIYYQIGEGNLLSPDNLLPHSIIYKVQKESLSTLVPDDLKHIEEFWDWMNKQLTLYSYLSYDINTQKKISNEYYNLANYFLSFKLYNKAVTLYKNSIKLQPKMVQAHVNLALCYLVFGLIDEAIRETKIGIDLEPDNATLYNNLGSIYLEKKDFKKAESYLLKALELNPKLQKTQENYKKLKSILEKNNAA